MSQISIFSIIKSPSYFYIFINYLKIKEYLNDGTQINYNAKPSYRIANSRSLLLQLGRWANYYFGIGNRLSPLQDLIFYQLISATRKRSSRSCHAFIFRHYSKFLNVFAHMDKPSLLHFFNLSARVHNWLKSQPYRDLLTRCMWRFLNQRRIPTNRQWG